MDVDHDPITGEILDPVEQVAADGGRRHPAASTLADFVRMLEDGQFDADVTADLRDASAEMEDRAAAHGGGKIKALLTIKVEIVREPDGLYMLTPSHTIKLPEEKRGRSVAWLTDQNLFTPNKPNQGNLFGTIRDVSARRDIKN